MEFQLHTTAVRRGLESVDSPVAADCPGPAVILDAEHRPVAYRRAGTEWRRLGYEAADHWSQLAPELQDRLRADPRASLDVTEFKATTGGSASLVTNNWVRAGSPRVYRVAGELRELTEVLAEIGQ